MLVVLVSVPLEAAMLHHRVVECSAMVIAPLFDGLFSPLQLDVRTPQALKHPGPQQDISINFLQGYPYLIGLHYKGFVWDILIPIAILV